jgi:TP901 family phage tail tape measure protein
MALSAGSVYTVLSARMNPAGFKEFDSANKKAITSATEAETRIAASQGRLAKAQDAVTASAGRGVAANENLAKSHVRLRESIPLAAMTAGAKSYAQAEKNLNKLGAAAGKTAAVGIVAVGAAAVYAASKATTFNREMLKIQTQADGSAAEVKKLSGEVLALAGHVPQGPQQLAEGLYHIESAGFRGAQAMEMLKAAAMGAALGNSNLESTTQAMISVMASQIKGVSGSADAMSQLNSIVGAGDVRMEDLAKAMGSSGLLPVAAHFGLTLRDVGAMIATTTDNATPAAVTLTRLRMAISLLGASSPKATKELATIGIGSKQLATDMRAPNGGLVAIEDLAKHLKDSGKTATEQAQLVSKAFGGGRSSAGITLLLDEITRLQSKYSQLEKSAGPQKLAESWAAFQKSQSAGFGELKSGAEALAITVGNVLMPTLTKLAREGTHALEGFIKSGGAAKLGSDISGAFDELGHVVGDLAPPIEAAAKALIDLGRALGLGNANEVAALAAGFLAFRAATFVAPMLIAIASAISEVAVAAVTADSLSAFGGDIAAMVSPVGVVAAGVGLLAGAFILLSGHEESAAQAARSVAAATEAEKAAITSLNEAVLAQAGTTIGAERADANLAKAKAHLADVAKRYGKDSPQYKTALEAERDAALRDNEAHVVLTKSKEATAKANKKAAEEAHKNLQKAKELRDIELVGLAEGKVKPKPGEDYVQAERKREIEILQKYNASVQQSARGTALAAISQLQLYRVLQGGKLITDQAAVSVSKLTAIWNQLSTAQQKRLAATPEKQLAEIGNLVGQLHGVSTRQQVEILVKADSAKAQIAALTAAVHGVPASKVIQILTTAHGAAMQLEALKAVVHGVPASKVIAILHNAASAKQKMRELAAAIGAVPAGKNISIGSNAAAQAAQMRALQAAIDSLHGKEISVVTNTVNRVVNFLTNKKGHASGRSPGQGELSLVGEGQGPEYVIDSSTGRGMVVKEPTLMGLGPEDYVIPTEDRYRGRAMGLFSMLAREWGVPGYKAGKGKGKPKHHYAIPNAIPPLSLPLTEIETRRDAAKTASDKAHSHVKDLEGKVKSARSPKSKDHHKLAKLQHELAAAKQADAADKRELARWNRTVHDAKVFQGRMNRTHSELENGLAAMKVAAGRDDPAAYEAARHRRLDALARYQAIVKEARAQVKTGTEYALELEGKLLQAEDETQGTQGEAFQPTKTKAEEEEERTGMTPAELAEEKRIEAGIALAALTPDLADDKARAQELVDFLTRVLGEVQAEPGPRGGDEAIIQIAGALKTAQGNLASFSGGGTNENADLQAQIDQQKARAEAAEATVRVQEGALEVLGGPGDIGAGGRTAAGAAAGITINQTNNMLHPGDPNVLRAIGKAAIAGVEFQGVRLASRLQLGASK